MKIWSKQLGLTAGFAVISLLVVSCSSTLSHSTGQAIQHSSHPWTGESIQANPILVVKIDDTQAAHPQLNVDKADIVYIEQVEGGLTRLAAFFSSTYPNEVGPVRSARISDIDILAQYGRVALSYSGAQHKLFPVIAAANLVDVKAGYAYSNFYFREPSRFAPTNLMVKSADLMKHVLQDHPNIQSPSNPGYEDGDLSTEESRSCIKIKSVTVSWPSSRYKVAWSEALHRWSLYFNGTIDVDASGDRLGSPTFIIQKVRITPSIYKDRHGGVTPLSETVGAGAGYLLRDGCVIDVQWSRFNSTSPTRWSYLNGATMTIPRGQIWIALTDNEPRFLVREKLPVVLKK